MNEERKFLDLKTNKWYTIYITNFARKAMKKLLVVDGNSILNRAFYGIRILTNNKGLPTNAVYGMVTILTRHIEMVKPDYLAIAFDLKALTFRHKMYDLYKANRHGMPEELAQQLPYAKECVKGLGFHLFEMEGYEADDILGTLSKKAEEEGVEAYVLTGDRDSLQLISDTTHVLLATNKDTIDMGRGEFREKYGIDPEQFVDVKALMGDSSDNIPGVAGIGEKTAFKLISDFGCLDKIYEEYESSSLTASVKNKLSAGKEMAYISKELATICRGAPITADMIDLENHGFDKNILKPLFEELEFGAFIKKFGLDSNDSAEDNKTDVQVEKKNISIENVTFAEAKNFAKDKTVSLYLDQNTCELSDGERVIQFELEAIANIKDILDTSKIICYDCKALYHALDKFGLTYRNAYFDVMLGAYVCDSNRTKFALPELYLAYVGEILSADASRAVAIYEIYKEISARIEKENTHSLMYDMEMPLASVLTDMELAGFKLDVDGTKKYGEALGVMADALAERIYYAAGGEFNINSPKQLGEVLFERLGMPALKKTKTGYSTDAETLSKLAAHYPIVEDILDYRQVTKLKSTYAEGLTKLVDENGRIHTTFNQTGTATGRLSSAEPNLQNIPVKTEMGREFRKFFIPKSEDYVIVDADYSQIELRLLAHISNDDTMISAFTDGADIHTSTAARVFGVDPEQVTIELRKKAKAVNFGILYGMGAFSLSTDLKISVAEASKYIKSYLEGFPEVSAYLENIKKSAREAGYVTTLYNRRRYIPELAVGNKNIQAFGERVAMNSPIQGTAADIIKLAMINVANRLCESGLDARLILQVHDELLLEAHKDCAEEAMKILVEEMENTASLKVPLSVEAHIGNTWFEAK